MLIIGNLEDIEYIDWVTGEDRRNLRLEHGQVTVRVHLRHSGLGSFEVEGSYYINIYDALKAGERLFIEKLKKEAKAYNKAANEYKKIFDNR